jgi:hypothetical protein
MDWMVAAIPTVLVVTGLVVFFRWLGAHHRGTWGEARRQKAASKPVFRDSTWMRGGGGWV